MAITDPTLDPVTGIPLDASYATQYQVPLGSQPINLDELNARGKQSNWLYPDNLPPVVARLQARDLTNPGNAQDLSTDGERNLNVNIAKGGGGSITNLPYQLLSTENVAGVTSSNYRASFTTGFKIQGFRYSLALAPGDNNTDKNIWIRFFAFDQHSSSKWDLMVDTLYCDNTNKVFKPIVQGYISWNPLWDLLATLETPQVSPIVFGFQLGGAGGLSLGGGFDLYYADM